MESRAASALASALPMRAASRAAVGKHRAEDLNDFLHRRPPALVHVDKWVTDRRMILHRLVGVVNRRVLKRVNR